MSNGRMEAFAEKLPCNGYRTEPNVVRFWGGAAEARAYLDESTARVEAWGPDRSRRGLGSSTISVHSTRNSWAIPDDA